MQDTYVARRQWTGVGTFSEIIGTIERLVFLWGHIATRVCVVGVELVVMVVSVAKCHDDVGTLGACLQAELAAGKAQAANSERGTCKSRGRCASRYARSG